MCTRLPSLLTVEEAAALLRIGRTKAYAMAQQWRATGCRSGLPVVDFGNMLRVPLVRLEEMVGGPLFSGDVELLSVLRGTTRPSAAPSDHESTASSEPPTAVTSIEARPRRRSRGTPKTQLDLFDFTSADGEVGGRR